MKPSIVILKVTFYDRFKDTDILDECQKLITDTGKALVLLETNSGDTAVNHIYRRIKQCDTNLKTFRLILKNAYLMFYTKKLSINYRDKLFPQNQAQSVVKKK